MITIIWRCPVLSLFRSEEVVHENEENPDHYQQLFIINGFIIAHVPAKNRPHDMIQVSDRDILNTVLFIPSAFCEIEGFSEKLITPQTLDSLGRHCLNAFQ
jgi:hypothetical protein